MWRLCRAANLPEAYLLRALLERAGITVRVLNEHAHGALGDIPFTQAWPELWLEDERDLARARELLAAQARSPGGAERDCPACGEPNPPGFELCWRCGKPFAE